MIARALIGLVALEHFYFLVLEMFLWRTRARRIFGMTPEQAEATAKLAANQGLYNGFLAAGLVWALATDMDRAPFFLVCIAIAGIYGSYSVNRRIFYVQSIPALVALVALHIR